MMFDAKKYVLLLILNLPVLVFSFLSESAAAQTEVPKYIPSERCSVMVGSKGSIGRKCRVSAAPFVGDGTRISLTSFNNKWMTFVEQRGLGLSGERIGNKRIDALISACKLDREKCSENGDSSLLYSFSKNCVGERKIMIMKRVVDSPDPLDQMFADLFTTMNLGLFFMCGSDEEFLGYWVPMSLDAKSFPILEIIRIKK